MTDLVTSAISRIEASRDELRLELSAAEDTAQCLRNRLLGLDEALAEIRKALPAETAAPVVKAERMDIAQAVLDILTNLGPHTIAGLAEGLERKPGQVRAALDRLGNKVAQGHAGHYYSVRPATDHEAA